MRVRPLTSLILVPDHLLTSYTKNSLFKICVLGTSFLHNSLQEVLHRSAKRLVRGCEKFVVALAYVFCLPLPGSCLARFAYLLADLCTLWLFLKSGAVHQVGDSRNLWLAFLILYIYSSRSMLFSTTSDQTHLPVRPLRPFLKSYCWRRRTMDPRKFERCFGELLPPYEANKGKLHILPPPSLEVR